MQRYNKKRRKVNKKKIFIYLVLPILLIISISGYINKDNIYTIYLSKTTSYSKDTIQVLKDNQIDTNILNKKYSKTLDNIINTEYFNPKYINSYLDITYHEKSNFYQNINSLLDLNYTSNDINNIYNLLSDNSISLIINNPYLKDLTSIINLSYFKEDYLERYLKYYTSNTDLSYENIILYVNIGLDNEYYTNVSTIDNQDDLLVLVNKYHKLDNDYVPSDLETINSKYQWLGRSNQLRHDARIAFEEMCAEATKDNIYIYAGSGYRSFATQKYLYDNYVKRDGFKAAETYSARASYSEHQTGLAMDIANKSGFISKGDKEYDWLVNNSYKYGFILRYPKGSETITGYMYEEWHYRYLGKEIAKEVYDSNLTYEEYLAKK